MSRSPIKIHFPKNDYISERNEAKNVIVHMPSFFLGRKQYE